MSTVFEKFKAISLNAIAQLKHINNKTSKLQMYYEYPSRDLHKDIYACEDVIEKIEKSIESNRSSLNPMSETRLQWFQNMWRAYVTYFELNYEVNAFWDGMSTFKGAWLFGDINHSGHTEIWNTFAWKAADNPSLITKMQADFDAYMKKTLHAHPSWQNRRDRIDRSLR